MTGARPILDHHEPLRDRTTRERRKHIAARIRDIGAAILLLGVFFAALGFERIVSEYVVLKEEVIALRAKVADYESYEWRSYRSGAREFMWGSRARSER